MPEDDDSDPNIYVDETITCLLPTADPDNQDVTEATQEADYVSWKEKTGIVLEVAYLNSLQNGQVEDSDSDDSNAENDDSYVSDESANKRAMAMMLSGEHPDAEIDKLLETFGV